MYVKCESPMHTRTCSAGLSIHVSYAHATPIKLLAAPALNPPPVPGFEQTHNKFVDLACAGAVLATGKLSLLNISWISHIMPAGKRDLAAEDVAQVYIISSDNTFQFMNFESLTQHEGKSVVF